MLILRIRPARWSWFGLLSACMAFASFVCATPATGAQASRSPAAPTFVCGGTVETAVWQLWDTQGRAFLQNELLSSRLTKDGDTYALYDIQGQFHNLQAMAQRCTRSERLIQLADDLMGAYSTLEPLQNNESDKAWVCRGGRVCNGKNRLVNKEVMLVSAQGLGLMSALANSLATSKDPKARAHPFIAKTVEVGAQHLLRWGGKKAINNWQRLANAKPEDVKNGSSALQFSDKDLWQVALYANLAGIYAVQPTHFKDLQAKPNQLAQLSESIRALLQLFNARISIETISHPSLGRVDAADIDRGFWRLHADNRYAGYEGNEKPAICSASRGDNKAQLMRGTQDVAVVENLGWDISHARRLVHALDALQNNRSAMLQVYDLSTSELPAANLSKAFAAQLVSHVWNGDKDAPLFTNYWSGANGWYRVGYDNGTGRCDMGNPPFGLSDSFATGGYAVWSKFYPVIGEVAHTIYALTQDKDSVSPDHAARHFEGTAPRISANTRMLTQLMFWPSLVQ